jgi:trans-aconitate methyltransferase
VGIDFRDPTNRRTYSGREANASWRAAVAALVDPVSADVVDIGCGGGTYTRAWHELGAATVTGVDFSAPILAAARESHGTCPGSRSAPATPRRRGCRPAAPTSSSSGR